MTQIAAIVTIAILAGMGIGIRATPGFTAPCAAAHFLLVYAVRRVLPGALAVSLNRLLLFRHHCFLPGGPCQDCAQALQGLGRLLFNRPRYAQPYYPARAECRRSHEQ